MSRSAANADIFQAIADPTRRARSAPQRTTCQAISPTLDIPAISAFTGAVRCGIINHQRDGNGSILFIYKFNYNYY